jgi:hypothetical protein
MATNKINPPTHLLLICVFVYKLKNHRLNNQQMMMTVAGNEGCVREVRGMGGDGGEEGA